MTNDAADEGRRDDDVPRGDRRALESNQLELEESLELYKRGVELLASLRARLADAEQQVSALMGQIEVDTDERDTTLS